MKRPFILVILFFCFSNNVKADTLTFREIYNFTIGDTFDYQTTTGKYGVDDNLQWSRLIVANRYYNLLNDTLFVDFLVSSPGSNSSTISKRFFTQLDTSIFFLEPNYSTQNCTAFLNFNGSLFGQNTNEIGKFCFEKSGSETYGRGLGKISYKWSEGSQQDNEFYEHKLVFYGSPNGSFGTKMETLSGYDLLGFYTPIPEVCAEWQSKIYTNFYPPANIFHYADILIRTDAIINQNGKRWVSLLFSYYDPINKDKVTDSLIGFFRNDSINKRVFFKQNIQDTMDGLLYDFSLPSRGVVKLSLETFRDGKERLVWLQPPQVEGLKKIAGIGSNWDGFIKVNSRPPCCVPYFYKSLRCGELVYNLYNADCYPLAISENQQSKIDFNVIDRQLYIWGEINPKSKMEIYDLLGKKLIEIDGYSLQTKKVDLSFLARGTYIVSYLDNEERKSKKIVNY
jgi:hypothetical protein